MSRLLQYILLTLVLLGAVSACNTMEGFGEDVESAGESIEGEADE